jgi:hypothetical protein
MKNQVETFKSENEQLKSDMEKIKNKQKETLKTEAETYINEKINNGFIRPAMKEDYINDYINFKSNDKDRFERFKNDIESRTKIINFNPTSNVSGQAINFKYEPEKMNFKEGATINYDELDKQIKAVMKAENISYKEACIKCGVATGSEFGDKE